MMREGDEWMLHMRQEVMENLGGDLGVLDDHAIWFWTSYL